MHPLSLAERFGWSHEHMARFYKRVKTMVSKFAGLIRKTISRSHGHFTMLGLDIIASAAEEIYLLEANSSPEISQPGRHARRLEFQEELLKEVVDIELALMAARRASHQQGCGGASCEKDGIDVGSEVIAAAR